MVSGIVSFETGNKRPPNRLFVNYMCVFTNLDKLLIDYQKTKHAQRRKKYYELIRKRKENRVNLAEEASLS